MPQQATIGPAPMEGVERTNVVVVRGQGFLKDGTPLLWTLIEGETVLLAGDSGIWPAIVGIGT